MVQDDAEEEEEEEEEDTLLPSSFRSHNATWSPTPPPPLLARLLAVAAAEVACCSCPPAWRSASLHSSCESGHVLSCLHRRPEPVLPKQSFFNERKDKRRGKSVILVARR